jgi:hypothetical protein
MVPFGAVGRFKERRICFLNRLPVFAPWSGNVGFEVEKVALCSSVSPANSYPTKCLIYLTCHSGPPASSMELSSASLKVYEKYI